MQENAFSEQKLLCLDVRSQTKVDVYVSIETLENLQTFVEVLIHFKALLDYVLNAWRCYTPRLDVICPLKF